MLFYYSYIFAFIKKKITTMKTEKKNAFSTHKVEILGSI